MIHPARVEQGWTFDIAGGTSVEHHRPPEGYVNQFTPSSSARAVLLLGAGYGFRLSENNAILVQVLVGSQLPTLDVYWQIWSSGFDLGFGALASAAPIGSGLEPGAYLLTGKGWRTDQGGAFRIDGGLRAQFETDYGGSLTASYATSLGLGPQVLISYRPSGAHNDYGLLLDYFRLLGDRPLQRCTNDSCGADTFLDSEWTVGAFTRFRF